REAGQEAELRAAVGEYTDKQWKEIGGAWDKELARLVKEKGAVDAQLNELSRIFALSVKEKQAEAIASGRAVSGDGSRAPISPVVPRPAIPEPPTLNPPARVEQPAPARSQQPSQNPQNSRSPFDEFPVLRPGGGSGTPPSTAVATPPSVPKTGGTTGPRSEQEKTVKVPRCGPGNLPYEWLRGECGREAAPM